jgi:hypothetical protein
MNSLSIKEVNNCILEAELLVYNSQTRSIERFGGVQGFRFGRMQPSDDRHLYLVFYDILYFNDQNFLHAPLSYRREQLISVIRPLPGFSQISDAKLISVPRISDWTLQTFQPLKSHFIQTIAAGQEGLIVKSTISMYRPGKRMDWIKVKPDYIRGLGDTGEYCIVGGAYEPSNTFLNLRLEAHPYLMNRFFIGVLLNKKAFADGVDCPHFRVLFTLEAGFSRESLIDFCQNLQRDRIRFEYGNTTLPFTIDKDNYTPRMDFVFLNPIPVTLKGSSFEKRNSGPWVPRHPRLVQICTPDISLSQTISYAELQQLGRDSESLNTQETKDLLDHLNDLDLSRLEELNLAGSDTASLSGSQTISLDCATNNGSDDFCLQPERCWIYPGRFKGFDHNSCSSSCIVHSPDAVIVGCGWNCVAECKSSSHRPGIVFCSDSESNQVIEAFEGKSQGTCLFKESIYIVDPKWISIDSSVVSLEYIIATISPFY